jgi:hypothetical protein
MSFYTSSGAWASASRRPFLSSSARAKNDISAASDESGSRTPREVVRESVVANGTLAARHFKNHTTAYAYITAPITQHHTPT